MNQAYLFPSKLRGHIIMFDELQPEIRQINKENVLYTGRIKNTLSFYGHFRNGQELLNKTFHRAPKCTHNCQVSFIYLNSYE